MTRQTEVESERVKRAGERLRYLREEVYKYDQRKVKALTGGRLSNTQVGNIERGQVARPSMRDLCILGTLYGVTPNQLASLYGYWESKEPSILDDTRLLKMVKLLSKMNKERRDQLLRDLEVTVRLAAAVDAVSDDDDDEELAD
jgi:transcriptional regulator with XRE-family HTH domain